MTADPTPVPMVISVAGLAVARKTLPASRDDAAVLPAPSIGTIQALSTTPPEWNGRAVGHETRKASLASLPRSTKAIERPSYVRTCPTGSRGTSCRSSRLSTVSSCSPETNLLPRNASRYHIQLASGPFLAASTLCGCATASSKGKSWSISTQPSSAGQPGRPQERGVLSNGDDMVQPDNRKYPTGADSAGRTLGRQQAAATRPTTPPSPPSAGAVTIRTWRLVDPQEDETRHYCD